MTAPLAAADAVAVFAVMSRQHYDHRGRADGFSIYPVPLALEPDFFVKTGDPVYYDHGSVHARDFDLARHDWGRMLGGLRCGIFPGRSAASS